MVGVWEDRDCGGVSAVQIGKQYGLHELQLRSLNTKRNVPQIIESDTWLVINFLVPRVVRGALKTDKLSVLMNKNQAVTLHAGDLPTIAELTERLALRPEFAKTPSGILATIADIVTEQYNPVLDYIDTQVDSVEDIIVNKPTDRQLHQLFHYKKMLVELRRVVMPTTALLNQLGDGRYKLLKPEYYVYLRDSYDFSWRAHELIDTLRDLLSSALDTYLSVVSNNLNVVMKRLTVISSVFMPISFLVGFGGMNFTRQIPFDTDAVFWVLFGLILVTPVAMILYFKHKKWL